jgi:ABC-2 type transport system permease protein
MIRTIAWHEFWFTVKKKSYYLVTLGMPLLVLGYLGIIALIVLATVPSELSRMGRPTGIVDRSGILTAKGAPLEGAKFGEEFEVVIQKSKNEAVKKIEKVAGNLNADVEVQDSENETKKVILFEYVEDAKELLADETLKGIAVIPADYISKGEFEVYSQRTELIGSSMSVGWISGLIRKQILKKTQLSDDEVARIRKSAGTIDYEVNSRGEFEEVNWLSKGLSLGLPLGVAGLLVLALMMNASLLLASIAEEKENKVMEVIVSSVSANDLLFGKVLGIVMAGLLQIAIWMAMISVIPVILMTAFGEVVDYEINLVQLLLAGVFMVMGFLFYGSLLAGMGSLGSTYKECQQLSAVVILCACVPMMMPTIFLSDPNSIVPRLLSMIPFFSPIGMTLRLGSGQIAMWEVGISFLILVVSTWFAIKVAAKLFRAGTLMRGKPPGVREIWKVLMEPQ